MRIFALELNNDLKGLSQRKEYIENLIAQLPAPDLVLLPELSLPSYMPNQKIWAYADKNGKETATWAMTIAKKYQTYIGVGYVDDEKGHYYNRYLIANQNQVYGTITKNEAEAAVFKRGQFDHIIKTPFGNVAVGICYDARRKHFYDTIKNKPLSLIVLPHGSPFNPRKEKEEINNNDFLCTLYLESYDVPVVYVNSVGKLEHMPGMMGALMKLARFSMNGKSKIYASSGTPIQTKLKEAHGLDVTLLEKTRQKEIPFYKQDIRKENTFFRKFILKPDIIMGIKKYHKHQKRKPIKRARQ